MEVTRHADAAAFCERALPMLVEREAENNLMIEIALRLRDSGGANQWGEGQPLLVTAEEGDRVVGAAVRMPPHNLLLARGDRSVVTLLAGGLHEMGERLPGALGPREPVANFAEAWSERTGGRPRPGNSLRIYQLEKVTPVARVPGRAEWATEAELGVVLGWGRAMGEELGLGETDLEREYRRLVREQRLLLWRDPDPVTMAGYVGETSSGVRISAVYTPPEHRRRGYGSAVVAVLSQRMLNSGRRFCYVFTDLGNAVSNHMYQKIGYRAVCDVDAYRFVDRQSQLVS